MLLNKNAETAELSHVQKEWPKLKKKKKKSNY